MRVWESFQGDLARCNEERFVEVLPESCRLLRSNKTGVFQLWRLKCIWIGTTVFDERRIDVMLDKREKIRSLPINDPSDASVIRGVNKYVLSM